MKDAIQNLDYITPAFIIDECSLIESVMGVASIAESSNCQLLFAIKSFAIADALHLMTPYLDGFAVSSLFEAKLAREVLGSSGSVHITTPGIRPDEIRDIAELCDFISFNSLSQWERFRELFYDTSQCGIRVNPQLSFLNDDRYDPCRKYSKLGIPLDQLSELMRLEPARLKGISGLLFHTNCLSSNFSQLLSTVARLQQQTGELFKLIKWVNLGGGYVFDDLLNLKDFNEAVVFLQSTYGIKVFIEPGAGIIQKAGFLISSVLDLFENDGKMIAILDTTVNHMPEVFEYQFEPDIIGHRKNGRYEYVLAGCTCLAGDLFGEYAFDDPLEIGSRIVFINAGAYTLVKAHMFNGVNFPTIYALTQTGELIMKKSFTYDNFLSRCGANTHVTA